MEQAENPIFIHSLIFKFLGFENLINPYSVGLFSMCLVLLVLWIAKSNMKIIPSGAQNFVEMVIDFVQDMSKPIVGKHASFFFPLFFMLFLYIFFSNLMGLIPGLVSPTSRLDVNLGMALIVFFFTHIWGIKEKGFKYFEHFLPPKIPANSPNILLNLLMRLIYLILLVLMPIIHVVGELVRPVSLTFRLFGNMMAKEKLLAVLVFLSSFFLSQNWGMKMVGAFPLFLRVAIVVLGVFVSFVQAFVFMLLAMVYIGGAVQSHEGHEEHGESEEQGHSKA